MLHEFSEIDDPAAYWFAFARNLRRKRSRIVGSASSLGRAYPTSVDVTDSLDLGTQALLSEAVAGINSGLTDKDKQKDK